MDSKQTLGAAKHFNYFGYIASLLLSFIAKWAFSVGHFKRTTRLFFIQGFIQGLNKGDIILLHFI